MIGIFDHNAWLAVLKFVHQALLLGSEIISLAFGFSQGPVNGVRTSSLLGLDIGCCTLVLLGSLICVGSLVCVGSLICIGSLIRICSLVRLCSSLHILALFLLLIGATCISWIGSLVVISEHIELTTPSYFLADLIPSFRFELIIINIYEVRIGSYGF